MKESKVVRSKKSKFIIRSKCIVGSTFVATQLFSFHQYFIEAATQYIDMVLQV